MTKWFGFWSIWFAIGLHSPNHANHGKPTTKVWIVLPPDVLGGALRASREVVMLPGSELAADGGALRVEVAMAMVACSLLAAGDINVSAA